MADASLKELAHVKKHLKAEGGGDGRQNNCMGRNADNLFIKVGIMMIGYVQSHLC